MSGDEVVIDQLEDFLRSHTRHLVEPDPRLLPPAAPPAPYKHLVPVRITSEGSLESKGVTKLGSVAGIL